MKKLLNNLPLPIGGLMLALAAGNKLVKGISPILSKTFILLSFAIGFLLIFKIVLNFQGFKENMNNPVLASVTPTICMAFMVLSVEVISINLSLAKLIWWSGIISHSIFIVFFTIKYVLSFSIKKVFPSYFIVYVGIVCASVTAPAYKEFNIGKSIFWFGLIMFLVWLPIIFYRVLKIKNIPDKALPTITIFAAPASLCLAGYLSSFIEKNLVMVYFLLTMSVSLVIFAILFLPKMLKNGFFPSYSAFTFPFVISSIAGLKSIKILGKDFTYFQILGKIVLVEKIIAITFIFYVLIKYLVFINSNVLKKEKLRSVS